MSRKKNISVTFIGSGNVASQLALAFAAAKIEIRQIYSPQIAHAKKLSKKVNAKAIDSLSQIEVGADIYIIAINDDAISKIVGKLKPGNSIVVHTAGSISIEVLHRFPNHGILYPLQTLSAKRKTNFSKVPLCLEASSNQVMQILNQIGKKIQAPVFKLDSDQRKAAHLAAVFACNFTNQLYAIAAKIASENQLPFDLLRPLIMETASKVQSMLPVDAQTGPAVRNDKKVMQQHLQLLQDQPELKKLYREISRQITNSTKR
jgi:predicted short-subunit dehydrogenase-like oxidoreductase (DUF2520 family)